MNLRRMGTFQICQIIPSITSDVWKAIPSETSVTGHEVSGMYAITTISAWKAVLLDHIVIPETPSRFSLASLGSVFQTEICMEEIYDGK